MKKSILLALILILIVVSGILITRNSSEEMNIVDKDVMTSKSSTKKETEANGRDYSEYSKPIIQYIETIKSGSSDDLYFEKLEHIRSILSTDLYNSLMPNLSEEQKDAMRSEQNANNKYSSKTSNYEISYSFLDSNVQDVYVIYTYQTLNEKSINESRYLFHAKVEEYKSSYVIVDIIEDSQLMEGLYSKVK